MHKSSLSTSSVLCSDTLFDFLELLVYLIFAHTFDLNHIHGQRVHHAKLFNLFHIRSNVATFALEEHHDYLAVFEVALRNLES